MGRRGGGCHSLSVRWNGAGAFRKATAELMADAPRDLHRDRNDDEARRLMDRAQRMA